VDNKTTNFSFFAEFGGFAVSAACRTMTHARAQSRQPPHVTRARGLGLDGRPGHLQGRNARSELGRFFRVFVSHDVARIRCDLYEVFGSYGSSYGYTHDPPGAFSAHPSTHESAPRRSAPLSALRG